MTLTGAVRAMAAALVLLAASACSRGDTAVPRRTAYPRPHLYDSVYTAVDSLPVRLYVNSGIRCSGESRSDGSRWLNLHYDRYGVTVYCTLTPVDAATADAVIDNRSERLYRNIAQASAEISEIDSPDGYRANLIVARGAAAPVQFIAVDPMSPRWVLSGSAIFDDALSAEWTDSVAPLVGALERDLAVMMQNLSDTGR